MTCHGEILEARQRFVLRKLGEELSDKGWYLAGGTGLALYLGHRKSVDFRWFNSNRLQPENLAQELRSTSLSVEIQGVGKGTLHAVIEGVQVSFFEYTYPLLDEPVRCHEVGVDLASFEDLACMKLSAVAQRGSKKDLVDIWAVLQRVNMRDLLRLYKRKFGVRDVGPVLYAVTYFGDAERDEMPEMLWEADWEQMKADLQRRVREVWNVEI